MTSGKGSKKRAEKRVIEQYCSVCKKSFEMEVVDGDESTGVLWLKCPGCVGYLPYMIGDDESEEGEGGASKEPADEAADLAPEDIDKDTAREYSEAHEYQVGEIVYHRSWNDYGRVIAKETLPGSRRTIVVHFINQGKIRLLEAVT